MQAGVAADWVRVVGAPQRPRECARAVTAEVDNAQLVVVCDRITTYVYAKPERSDLPPYLPLYLYDLAHIV